MNWSCIYWEVDDWINLSREDICRNSYIDTFAFQVSKRDSFIHASVEPCEEEEKVVGFRECAGNCGVRRLCDFITKH